MGKRYQIIGTTADLGLKVFGKSPDGLFENAAAGLVSLMTNPRALRIDTVRDLRLEASGPEDLLFDWLNRIIYLYETEGFLGKRFQVKIRKPWRLQARLEGEILDRSRHQILRVVKAATYHRLEVTKTGAGWRANVILDV